LKCATSIETTKNGEEEEEREIETQKKTVDNEREREQEILTKDSSTQMQNSQAVVNFIP